MKGIMRHCFEREDPLRRDRANVILFLLTVPMGAAYLILYGPGLIDLPIAAPSATQSVVIRLMILSPLMFVGTFLVQRARLIPIDRHMIYLPLLLWYVAFIGTQSISGHSKSLSNAYLESLAVLALSCLYLLRFALTDDANPKQVAKCSAWLASFVCAGAITVALLMPSLSE
jgi:hypothetical protein